MRRAAIVLALATLQSASPAAAQRGGELSWAISTCLRNIGDFHGAMQAYTARGYRYSPEDFGGGPQDVIHWYTSPDGSVTAAIAFGGAHDGSSCRLVPKGITVGQAVPYARSAAEKLLGVPFKAGTPRGMIDDACGAWAKVGGCFVQIEAGSDGQDPICDAAAPAQIMINVTKG